MPLSAHPAFRVSGLEALSETIETRLAARYLSGTRRQDVEAWGNRLALPAGELWFCSYGDPVTLAFADSDYLRVQFHHAGAGSTQSASKTTAITASQACISSAAAIISFGAGFQQLVWRVSLSALSRKLAAIAGRPPSRPLQFASALDVAAPRAAGLLHVLQCIVRYGASAPAAVHPLVLAELEQAFMIALLTGSDHNAASLLQARPPNGTPRLVRRIEEYIEAHWDRPFDIADAVALSGCSARTIYRQFRRVRGYSPTDFSKQQRLQRARDMLREGGRPLTVTEVALACGFSDLSHFTRDFSRTFGQAPSTLLKIR